MKPVFARILEDLRENVFAVRTIDLPVFSTEFHFHKECQMVYVVEGEGKRIIGDSVETFKSDELILLGSDIPHVWHNDKSNIGKGKKETHARSLALFFQPEKLVELLSHFIPTKKLEGVLKTSQRGLLFSGKTKRTLKQLLFELNDQEGFQKLITLLKIFETLCASKEYKLLASSGYKNTYQSRDNDRIDKVFKYIFSHFTSPVTLDEVAAVAHMSKQAFCRYFKSRTQKTLIEFITDVRISHACKLIAEGETSISGLAYNCGFNSLSNFNKSFKDIKGVTPREYKKMLVD